MMEHAAQAAYLREQAAVCIRLANSILDQEAIAALRNMAMRHESVARRLELRTMVWDQPVPSTE